MASSPPQKFGSQNIKKFRRDFAQRHDLIANISGTEQDIVNRKPALQTTDTPAQATLIRCTLVYHSKQLFNTVIPTVAGGRSLTLCWFGHA